jgi:hypothetical protein
VYISSTRYVPYKNQVNNKKETGNNLFWHTSFFTHPLDSLIISGLMALLYHGGRYFLVIDDVWETESWETIKLAFVENNRESRIITTTRKHEVAGKADEVYKLQPLSDLNSRKLFFARLFGGESKFPKHQPNDISEKILRCGGIPLVSSQWLACWWVNLWMNGQRYISLLVLPIKKTSK